MLIKRFDTFLESPVEAQWITADSAGCAEKQQISLAFNYSDICLIVQSTVLTGNYSRKPNFPLEELLSYAM